MSNFEVWNDWLTSKLGQEMRTFDDATSSLLESQKRAFSLHCDLLREDEASLGKRSSSSRSVRLRARNVLKNIFQVLGPEVFLLCTLAVPFSKLGDNAPRTRVATLQDWWNGIQPPQGLVTIAKEECDENAIETLLSSAPKDLFSESVVLGEQYSFASSAKDFTKTTGGTVTFLSEKRESGFAAVPKLSVHTNSTTLQHAVTAFEDVVFYAAENIPEAEVRQAWISSCLGHLRLLKSLISVNEGQGSKRLRATHQQDYPGESNCSKRLKQTTSIRTSNPSVPFNSQAGNALSHRPSVSQPSSGLSPLEKPTPDRHKDTCLQNPTGPTSDLTEEHVHTTRHVRFRDEGATISGNVEEATIDGDNVGAPLGQPGNDGSVKEPLRTMELGRHGDAIPIERQIEYRFSEAQLTRVHVLHESLLSAIQKSKQWKWERELGGATTDCLNILSPKNRDQDISITIMVGFEEGMQLVEDLDLKKAR